MLVLVCGLVGNGHRENGASADALFQLHGAAMGTCEFLRDGKAKARAAAARRAAERSKQVLARLLWQAGAGVGHAHAAHTVLALGTDGKAADDGAAGLARHGLHRVAAEVGEDPEQLLGIGVDLEIRIDIVDEFDAAAFVDSEHALHFVDQLAKAQAAAGGRRFLRTAIGEHALRIGHGAVESAHESGRERLDGGVLHRAQAIGHELRRGQDVAHVVIDLGDREAKIGQMLLFAERLAQMLLHAGEFPLGNADLVGAILGHHDAAGIVRPAREGDTERVMVRIGRIMMRLMA